MSSFAPLQFLKSAWNPLVWTAVDNETDTRTSLIIYNGAVNTLPLDTGQYEVNCIMMHQAEKQLYSNVGTVDVPNWAPFGPGSQYPQPLIPGTFLFTDGVSVYWSTALVGQVQYNGVNLNQYGILNFKNFLVATNDVPNTRVNVDLDVVGLANDSTFINALLANSSFISGISTALLSLSSFISSLISTLLSNSTFISGIVNIVNTNGSIQIDLSTQVTGLLNGTHIDQSTLNLSSIGGTINLNTQTTGTLGLGNGGTGASLSDPNYNAAWVWDDTTNATRLAHLSGLTYNSATNTLSVGGAGRVADGFSLPSYRYQVTTGPTVDNVQFPSQQIIKFGKYIFFGQTSTNPGSGTFPRSYRVYELDSVTGEAYSISAPFVQNPYSSNYSMALYSSFDESLLYHAYYNSGLSGPGPVYNITMNVDVYDTNLNLVNSFTGTVGTGADTSGLRSMFVIGNTAYLSTGTNINTFTLSAGTITAGASAGSTTFRQATYDGSYLWTISSNGTTFGKYTVSGTTITPVSATFKYPVASGSLGLYTSCDIGYGIYLGNNLFGIWTPDTIGIAGSTNGSPAYLIAQENARCTLREFPLP